MSTLQLVISYEPHKGQRAFHESLARFRILACGRRFGKTIAGANEAVKVCLKSPEGSVGFCVAPTFGHTQKMWREFFRYCPREVIREVRRAEHHVVLVGNRHVYFKSADEPDSLRGEALSWMWMDEGAQISEEAWELALRPSLMDTHGIAWFTGTPKGKNWYWRLWTRGQDPLQADFKSWAFSSASNPYLDPLEIADFARDMSELAYRQEILAEFIEDVGSVFRNVESCIKGKLAEPDPSHNYVMGVDLAKHMDFTVLVVMDDACHVCAFERFDQLDWVHQRKRVVALAQKYNARVVVDSSGVGDPVVDELRRHDLRVEGFRFTNASKSELIENLSMMIDQQKVTFPNITELVNELKLYAYTMRSNGLIRYGAPSSYHDDCVIALAFTAWMMKSPYKFYIA